MPTPTYDLIEEQVLGTAASTVTFSSIPGTYKDLVVEAVVKATTGSAPSMYFRVNGDTGTTYGWTRMGGTGSSTFSDRGSNATYVYSAESDSTVWSTNFWQVMSYANTNVNKSVLMRAGNTAVNVTAVVGTWRSTSAITSVSVIQNATTFVSGSTFRLWGVSG